MDVAEAFAKALELEKSQKYIEKALEVLENKIEIDCLPCKMKKSRNLIQIIRELKRVI